MDIPPAGTIATLIFFVVIGLIPVIPIAVRYGLVIVAALAIYFGLDAAMFNLPNGDNLAISALFGGTGGMGKFNKLSMGVVGAVIGILFTTIGAVLQKVLSKKDSSN